MNLGGNMAQRLARRALSGKASHAETREVAFVRQMIGTWPPPSGGVTW